MKIVATVNEITMTIMNGPAKPYSVCNKRERESERKRERYIYRERERKKERKHRKAGKES